MVVWYESCENIATLEGSCMILVTEMLSKRFLSHWTSTIARYPQTLLFLRSSLGLFTIFLSGKIW